MIFENSGPYWSYKKHLKSNTFMWKKPDGSVETFDVTGDGERNRISVEILSKLYDTDAFPKEPPIGEDAMRRTDRNYPEELAVLLAEERWKNDKFLFEQLDEVKNYRFANYVEDSVFCYWLADPDEKDLLHDGTDYLPEYRYFELGESAAYTVGTSTNPNKDEVNASAMLVILRGAFPGHSFDFTNDTNKKNDVANYDSYLPRRTMKEFFSGCLDSLLYRKY